MIKTYKSLLEQYWFEGNINKFNIELKKFCGYITRNNWRYFKQKSEAYNELRDRMICRIYEKLPDYDPNRISKKTGKPVDFRTFIQTYARGEGTKFFNKYDKEKKYLNISDCYGEIFNYDIDRDYIKVVNILEEIIKEYNIEANINKVIEYLLHLNKDEKNCLNIQYIRLIGWEFLKRRISFDKLQSN